MQGETLFLCQFLWLSTFCAWTHAVKRWTLVQGSSLQTACEVFFFSFFFLHNLRLTRWKVGNKWSPPQLVLDFKWNNLKGLGLKWSTRFGKYPTINSRCLKKKQKTVYILQLGASFMLKLTLSWTISLFVLEGVSNKSQAKLYFCMCMYICRCVCTYIYAPLLHKIIASS